MTQAEIAYHKAVREALLNGGVFPEGHEYAGMTAAEAAAAHAQAQAPAAQPTTQSAIQEESNGINADGATASQPRKRN